MFEEGSTLDICDSLLGYLGSRNGKMHNISCKYPLQLVSWGFNYLNWIKSVHTTESIGNTTNEFCEMTSWKVSWLF